MNYFVYYPKVGGTETECGLGQAVKNSWSDLNLENTRDLVAFIRCRPSLAERVILAANAAVHGPLANRITSVDGAVFMLGVDRVSSIAEQTLTP